MSSSDLYVAVRNAILESNIAALEQLKLSLNEDYRAASTISREQLLSLLFDTGKALSRDFSAEIYVPLKDRGGNPNNKGRVCTAIRYENIKKCVDIILAAT